MIRDSLVRLITIPKIFDDCYLYFAQNYDHIPFSNKRIYYITQAKRQIGRGFHAHHQTHQVLFCIQGHIKMVLDDGIRREEVILDKPEEGIFLNKMIWHEMHDFQENTILLVLASDVYKPEDYIRDYNEFVKLVKQKNQNEDKI